jgi:hypothetical protein
MGLTGEWRILARLSSYRDALKKLFFVAAGFSLRLHRRDAGATFLMAISY